MIADLAFPLGTAAPAASCFRVLWHAAGVGCLPKGKGHSVLLVVPGEVCFGMCVVLVVTENGCRCLYH